MTGRTAHPVRSAASVAGLLAVDLALALGLAWPAWADPGTVTVGARQDTPYTVWALAWVARALTHGHSPWITDHLSAPGGVNLLTNATATGLGVVLTPITRLFGPLVAFNVAATAALAATAWSAQLVLRRALRCSWPAAGVGGLVAGFGPTALAQTAGAHLHIAAAFLVPPMLLGVGRLASGTARSPGRWGAALGCLAAAQLLIGEEVLAIVAIAALAGLTFAGAKRRVCWPPLILGGLTAVVAFDLLAAWPLWVQFAGPAHIAGAIQRGDRYANDLTAFVVPNRQVWLGSGVSSGLIRRFSSEGGTYVGVPLIVAGVVAVRRRGGLVVGSIATSAGVLAVLSLGSRLAVGGTATAVPMPWALAARVPLLASLIPVRFGVVLDLAAGALLAVTLDSVTHSARDGLSGLRDRRRWPVGTGPVGAGPVRIGLVGAGAVAAGTVVAVLCLVALLPRLPFRTTRWATPAFFRSGRPGVADGSLIVVSPYPSETDPAVEVWLATAGARWRSAGGTYFVPDASGRVTIGGPVPISDAIDVRLEQGAPAASLIGLRDRVDADLRARHVAAIVVGPGPHRDEVIRWWTALLGPPRVGGGVDLWLVAGRPATS